MNYPLISEYVEAIRMAEDSFDQLCHLRPVLDDSGQPVMSSGNFAVVFKMQDTQSGKLHAVRCFHREQAGRTESYRQIEEALQQVSSPYLVTFRYLDRELFVDSRQTGGETEFPVLLMDWVEGVTLDRYLREHIGDCDTLAVLAYRFSLMAAWLLQQPFAHGDLKPDNILVRTDGSLTLVDYDGMFVPAMQGQASRELGSPDFRHPLRSQQDFDASIDDFPLVSILLSLKAISLNPSLLDKHGASDRLLFSEADYRLLGHCRVLQEIFPSSDNELNTLVSLFTLALTQGKLTGIVPSLLALAEPKCLVEEELSTEVTKEDLAEAVEDEYGVKYSKDGKRLLDGRIIKKGEYAIRKGTKVICVMAFEYCRGLTHIDIPDSVTTIGERAFWGCSGLTHIDIPDSVTTIGEGAFSWCSDLTRIIVSPDNPYYDSREGCNAIISTKERGVTLIRGCEHTRIPDNITTIGDWAFSDCYLLHHINIPDSVTTIGHYAFCYSGLTYIHIPDSVTAIGKSAFSDCYLHHINIPDSVTTIGERAFSGCRGLTHIDIPGSVTTIGEGAFDGCHGLTRITVSPDNPCYDSREDCNAIICTKEREVTLIRGCKHTHIPGSVTTIGDWAFYYCCGLTHIDIPDSVTTIGKEAFSGCSGLAHIDIPDSVTTIGENAFTHCSSLIHIDIPDSVTTIGEYAFSFCRGLTRINIPDSVTTIGKGAFYDCNGLTHIHIPKGTKEKFARLLPYYYKDKLVEE